MREAQFDCCARCKVRNLRELRSSTHLTSRVATLYCGDCTEVGAPEVDGLLIGSRFGGGQSGSRTREPPPRCIFCWRTIRSRIGSGSVRVELRAIPGEISSSNANGRKLRTFSDSGHLTERIAPPRFPCAPRTERRRLMALPIGTRFGGGQSGSRTKGQTGSVHFLWSDEPRPHLLIRARAVDIGCPDAPPRRRHQRNRVPRRHAVRRPDPARAGVRRRLRPQQAPGRDCSWEPSARAPSSAGSPAASSPAGSGRRTPSSAGSCCSRSRPSGWRSPTRRERSASPASSRASRVRSRGPERSPG